ncbi:MaoC family dehydratase [Actinotalea solisilvae]|uniref:MaoC family dehydratase n=1 Tax=Actinotalea solisilvae TaxID=2072922 RepID=UPI0018F1BB7F|nr:MaoC family dehydratase [Actinotalea solisilvae]
MSRPVLEQLAVGDVVGTRTVTFTRQDLVRYAGASGDLNPIHWNERFAGDVGLPGVIAHGMLTMGAAVNLVTDWAGDPGAIADYGVRFTRPVPVPDPGEAVLEVSGAVGAVDAEARTVRVDLTVTAAGERVLGKAQVTVRL